MKVDAVRAKALVSQLQDVQLRIANVAKGRNVSFFFCLVRAQHSFPLQPRVTQSSSHLMCCAVAAAPEGLRCRKGEDWGVGTQCGGKGAGKSTVMLSYEDDTRD